MEVKVRTVCELQIDGSGGVCPEDDIDLPFGISGLGSLLFLFFFNLAIDGEDFLAELSNLRIKNIVRNEPSGEDGYLRLSDSNVPVRQNLARKSTCSKG